MTAGFRWPMALATMAGLAAGVWALGRIGFSGLARAALDMGVGGFLLFCLASLGLTLLLGAAWIASMPGEPLRRLPLFAFARLAREGANDLLPFSQIGGLVVGARTLTGAGLPRARTYAGMIVDLTTEMASQLVLTLFGLIVMGSLLLEGSRHHVAPLAWIGGGVMLATTIAMIFLQKPMIRLAAALTEHLPTGGQVSLSQLHEELNGIYAHRKAVASAFLFNLAAWVTTAALAALALRLMGDPLPLWRAIALESLIAAIRSAAFFIPGAIGVQEAGYILLAQAVGLDPQIAVALSLAKRARDVTLGVPALLLWQFREIRPARAARGA